MNYHEIFNRRNGILKDEHILKIPFRPANAFIFPKESLAHHLPFDEVDVSPDAADLLYLNYDHRMLVDHVVKLYEPDGSPREVDASQVTRSIEDFHRKFRQMRKMVDLSKAIRDDNTLVVTNYGFLTMNQKYNSSAYSSYHKWRNILKTFVANYLHIRKHTERQHYLQVEIPKKIPGPTNLMTASKRLTTDVAEEYNSMEMVWLLELWKYIEEDTRKDSVFAEFTVADWDKLTVVYSVGGQWTMLRMGLLLGNDKLSSRQLQLRFIRLYMNLAQARSALFVDPVGSETVGANQLTVKDGSDAVATKPTSEDVKVNLDEASDSELEKETEQIVKEETERENAARVKRNIDKGIASADADQNLLQQITKLGDSGKISAMELNRLHKLRERQNNLRVPGSDEKLVEFAKVDPESTVIKEGDKRLPVKEHGIIDKSMLYATPEQVNRRYVKEVMDKHLAAVALSVRNAGHIVTDFKVEQVKTAIDDFKVIKIRVQPLEGEPETLSFSVPNIDEEGKFKVGNVKYYTRIQRIDVPIRKVKPHQVALTSYAAKLFVERSSRSVNNYEQWLTRNIVLIAQGDEGKLTASKRTNVFDLEAKVPRVYSIVSRSYKSFVVDGKYQLAFDYGNRGKLLPKLDLTTVEKGGSVLVGYRLSDKAPILMGVTDNLYIVKGSNITDIGSMEELLDLPIARKPLEVAEVTVFGKAIPIGICLGFKLGIDGLLDRLNVRPRRVSTGGRLNLQPNEFAVRFSDVSLVFSREDRVATMVMAGFNRFHRSLKEYSYDTFNEQDVYVNVCEENNIALRYVRLLDILFSMFVDPITKDVLEKIDEPTDLEGLFMRAVDLLQSDRHPRETDTLYQRFAGYERFAGMMYGELVNAAMRFAANPNKNRKLEVNPQALWQKILQDPAKAPVEESNPIHNLKELEAVTFSGHGGRNSRSMVSESRKFHKNDLGVISEATVDSGNVAVNTSFSPGASLKDTYGLIEPRDPKTVKPTEMWSTSALVSPGADMDDDKRINFISIQHSHGVACDGYQVNPVRTGYERVIPSRVGKLFAKVAEQNGKVLMVKDKLLRVEYEDGQVVNLEIGRRYGTVPGKVVPHDIVTFWKKGDTFERGDALIYNTGFFARDPIFPTTILWKAGVIGTVAMIEEKQTYEDASGISRRIANKMSTKQTYVGDVTVKFDQDIRNALTVGTKVDLDSILCTIIDAGIASEDEDLSVLNELKNANPKAGVKGVIDRIEVFYHGDKDDMSTSLRELADKSDSERKRLAKDMGETYTSGQVDSGMRIKGNPLEFENAVIKFYITKNMGMEEGDKAVVGNQLKTVISGIFTGDIRTQSGKLIDGKFSWQAQDNRVVYAAPTIATTITLLKHISVNTASKFLKSIGEL